MGLGVLGFFVYARQRSPGLEQTSVLPLPGELEAAESLIAQLEKKWPKIQQWSLDSLMGSILWLKGDFLGAIEQLERAQLSAKGVQRRSNMFTLAMLYAIVGRQNDAKSLRERLSIPQDSDLLRLMLAHLELCPAFHAEQPAP